MGESLCLASGLPLEDRRTDFDHLAYKRNSAEAVERLSLLWSRNAKDRVFARMCITTSALRQFADTHVDGGTSYPDPRERIAFWDAHLAEMTDLEDDSLPLVYLTEFDQGIYAGVLGAPMSFMVNSQTGWVSSMTPPILKDLSKIDLLKINSEVEAVRLLDKQLSVYSDAARGKYGIAPCILLDALNFVAELRGATQAYIDTAESPDETRQLMDFAYHLNVFVQERIHNATDAFLGGRFVNLAQWAPGSPVLISIDAYHLASPDFYYEWGEPHLQKTLDHFGAGVLHIHSNGRHLIKHAAKLDHLVCIQLIDEIWNPRAYEELEQHLEEAGGVPLIVNCDREEFQRDLDYKKLPGNVLYNVTGVQTVAEANRLMERVRAYRR